eukprot:13663356-Alexandrium_andersonii.AAC.1
MTGSSLTISASQVAPARGESHPARSPSSSSISMLATPASSAADMSSGAEASLRWRMRPPAVSRPN